MLSSKLSTFRKLKGCAVAALVLSCCLQVEANPQKGTVRWSGRAVPGAIVTASRGDRKIVTTSDEAGAYQFDELEAGEWKIEVQMFGFKPAERAVVVDGQNVPA